MSLKYSPPFALFFSFFLLLSSTNAFNITKLLGQYPSFTTFNNYLTQTQLVEAINSRQSITVLAVDNGAISTLSSQSTDTIKKILSVHVILDYFDAQKLQNLEKKSAILTTLFQSSGQATGQQGFLNVTHLSTGGVAFGSGVPGSNLGSNLVKSIASQPYNISVLQVSNVIMPTGMNGGNTNSSTNSTSPPSPPSPSPASTPSKSPTTPVATPAKAPTTPPKSKAPAPSTAKPPAAAAPPKSSKVPAPSTAPSNAKPPSNANAPSDDAADSPSRANAPSDASAPAADSPVGSPPMPADGPAADAPATVADGPVADTSGAPEMFGINLAVLLVMVVSSTWSLASVM